MPSVECAHCGVAFTPLRHSTRGVRRFCSEICSRNRASKERSAIKRAERVKNGSVFTHCVDCGRRLELGQRKFCSLSCNQFFSGAVKRGPWPKLICAFSQCDVEFTQHTVQQTCCSEAHGKRHYNERRIASGNRWYRRTDSARDAEHRKRAIKAGASTGAPVRLAYIAERDGYKCHLCSKKVNMKLKAPHPMSPSMDHVIPLSRGGAHDPVNVSLAHLRCNTAKNNRGSGEQLALIG